MQLLGICQFLVSIVVPVHHHRLFGEEMGHGRLRVVVVPMLFLMEQPIQTPSPVLSLKEMSLSEMQLQNGHVCQNDQQARSSELIPYERGLSGERHLVCMLQDEN